MVKDELVSYGIIFIAVVLFFVVLKELQVAFLPFTLAMVLAFLLMPSVRSLKEKQIPKGFILLIMLLAGFLGLAFFLFLTPDQVVEVEDFATVEPEVTTGMAKIQQKLVDLSVATGFEIEFDTNQINSVLNSAIKKAVQVIQAFFSYSTFVLIFLLFILPSYDALIAKITATMTRSKATQFEKAIIQIEQNVRTYLFVKTLVSVGTGVVSGFILYFFGVPFAFFFGLLIFALNYIPNIGSIIAVLITVVFVALTSGLTATVVWLLILLTMVQMFFGAYLEPKIAGQKLSLSPIVILISLFVWGWIWGIVGMLIAVPLTSVIQIILKNIKRTEHLAELIS